jgi:hypothetical protein
MLKSIIPAVTAIALSAGSAIASPKDFSRFGINVEPNTYCMTYPSSMPLGVALIKQKACEEEEKSAAKLYDNLAVIYQIKDKNPETWELMRSMTLKTIDMNRANVRLKVILAERKTYGQ